MQTHYAITVGICVGFAIGAVAVQSLHAQAKPPVYYIGENNVTNADGYRSEFLPLAESSIKAHGGRYIAAGNATALAGDPPKSRVIILVWNSMEQLQGWFNSPEYRKAREIGEKHAIYRNYAVPGVAQ
jgi:uncharacterized protein (DUF1330 family)